MLTKKREALVKLELASKNEKLPQAQEEVKEVRKLTSDNPNRNFVGDLTPFRFVTSLEVNVVLSTRSTGLNIFVWLTPSVNHTMPWSKIFLCVNG